MIKRALVFAVLLVPVAGASHNDVREYTPFAFVTENSNGVVGLTDVTIEAFHGFEVDARNTTVVLALVYRIQDGTFVAPMARFQLEWDGAAVTDCTWLVQGGTVSDRQTTTGFQIFCAVGNVEPGAHTFEIVRTAVTGTPITNAVISLRLTQTEAVKMENHILETISTLALPILFLITGALALRREQLQYYVIALVTGISTVVALWDGIVELRFLFIGLIAALALDMILAFMPESEVMQSE